MIYIYIYVLSYCLKMKWNSCVIVWTSRTFTSHQWRPSGYHVKAINFVVCLPGLSGINQIKDMKLWVCCHNGNTDWSAWVSFVKLPWSEGQWLHRLHTSLEYALKSHWISCTDFCMNHVTLNTPLHFVFNFTIPPQILSAWQTMCGQPKSSSPKYITWLSW